MRKSRIAGLVVAVAALASMLAIPAISGANHRVDTDIRVSNDRPALHGVLGSPWEACERDRLVVVKRVRRGRSNKFVGADASSFNGGWSVDVDRGGDYIVKVDGYGSCAGEKVRVNGVIRQG